MRVNLENRGTPLSIKRIKLNPKYTQVVVNQDFHDRLVRSIIDYPHMLKYRPFILQDDYTILGDNQRLIACRDAKVKKVYVILESDLTIDEYKYLYFEEPLWQIVKEEK